VLFYAKLILHVICVICTPKIPEMYDVNSESVFWMCNLVCNVMCVVHAHVCIVYYVDCTCNHFSCLCIKVDVFVNSVV